MIDSRPAEYFRPAPMKISATEFARLTELLAKGDALSADEQAEKAAIESRIVAEEGDPAPAADPAPEGEPQSDPSDESDPADDQEDPAETPDADLAAPGFAKLSIGQKFKVLMASRISLAAQLATAKGQVETLGADLAGMTQRATAAEAALATAQADLATARERVTALEAEASDLHAAVTDELSGIGVSADKLPGVETSGSDGTPGTEAELEERLKECQTHGERRALIQAYKKSRTAKGKAA